MEFRRSGARDERRRRVLIEEAKEAAGAEDQAASSARAAGELSGVTYGEAARDERQPRITALLPRRKLTLAVLLLLGASALAGLEALYGTLITRATEAQLARLAPVDLAHSNSLARWLSVALLLFAAQTSVIVFSLRRHRVDDYRGRYRVWCVASLVLVAASIESTTGFRFLLCDWLHAAVGWQTPGGSTFWRLALLGLLGLLATVRLGFEMRYYRPALVFLLLTALAYSAAAALSAGTFLPPGPLHVMAQQGALLAGHMLLVFTLLVYGRRVYLEAQGLIAAPAKKARKPRKPRADKKSSKAKTSESSDGAAASSDAGAKPSSSSRRTSSGSRIRIDAAHESDSSAPASSASPAATATAQAKSSPPSAPASAGTKPAPVQAKATLRVPAKPDVDSDDEDDDQDYGGDRRMSKAERKRLKKSRRS